VYAAKEGAGFAPLHGSMAKRCPQLATVMMILKG